MIYFLNGGKKNVRGVRGRAARRKKKKRKKKLSQICFSLQMQAIKRKSSLNSNVTVCPIDNETFRARWNHANRSGMFTAMKDAAGIFVVSGDRTGQLAVPNMYIHTIVVRNHD